MCVCVMSHHAVLRRPYLVVRRLCPRHAMRWRHPYSASQHPTTQVCVYTVIHIHTHTHRDIHNTQEAPYCMETVAGRWIAVFMRPNS